MGGPGSGKRSITPLVLEDHCRFKIWAFKRQGIKLRQGAGGFDCSWKYKSHRGEPVTTYQSIHLTWTHCHFGGQRPWFVCDCGRRVGVLFHARGRYVCRHCLGLPYASQNESILDRALRFQNKIMKKLGSARPKGMHRTTYRRWDLKAARAMHRSFGALMELVVIKDNLMERREFRAWHEVQWHKMLASIGVRSEEEEEEKER